MFADSTEQFPAQPAGMFIYVDDADKTYKDAIAEGATSIMEPANQSYGKKRRCKGFFRKCMVDHFIVIAFTLGNIQLPTHNLSCQGP